LRTLVEAVFESQLFGSFLTGKVLKEITTKYAQGNVFLPWRVLQGIDLAINFTGGESLRKMEDLGSYEWGFLPSQAMIQLCAKELHQLGQHLIPFSKVDCQLGEMYQFDYEKMVRFLLLHFSLHEYAKRGSIESCITLDGAELTKDLCHLTFGVKITDPQAIAPRDGTPLACQEDGIAS
jgi:hypothetical protein